MYIYHKQCEIMQKVNEKAQTDNFSVFAKGTSAKDSFEDTTFMIFLLLQMWLHFSKLGS